MLAYLVHRIALTVPTFAALTLLTFIGVRLVPGNPVEIRTGERGLSAERFAELSQQLGLDQPLWRQYFDYLGHISSGNLGDSLSTNEPVLREFATLFPATIELALFAVFLAVALGVPAGIIAATRRDSFLDHGLMGLALVGYSMPIFWWALILMLTFSVGLGWTPVSGRLDLAFNLPPLTGFLLVDTLIAGDGAAFLSALKHLVLPAIVLGTIPLASIARMTRSAMIEVLSEDYIQMAQVKGLPPWRIVWIHALRNALNPVVTVIGLQISTMLAGAVLTETIFAWPGVGRWLIEAIARRDYPVLQGGILLIALLLVALNFAIDLLLSLINPRLRHAR